MNKAAQRTGSHTLLYLRRYSTVASTMPQRFFLCTKPPLHASIAKPERIRRTYSVPQPTCIQPGAGAGSREKIALPRAVAAPRAAIPDLLSYAMRKVTKSTSSSPTTHDPCEGSAIRFHRDELDFSKSRCEIQPTSGTVVGIVLRWIFQKVNTKSKIKG